VTCQRSFANEVWLKLFVLAYNLGNFLRRLCLSKAIKDWSLRSLQVKLIKMGGTELCNMFGALFSNWRRWRCPETCLLPSWSG
jgi:hypothetical protein